MEFLDKMRRVTRDGHWIPEIDGLRFLAILAVILFHTSGELLARSGRHIVVEPRYSELGRWLRYGDRGVPLFFVISGMVLAMPFARQYLNQAKIVSLRKFYLRRLTRLEPPYLLSIVLFVSLFALYSHGHGITADYIRHIRASAFYMHNLIYGEMTPVNSVSWSLEVEIQFYLLAPLFMHLFRVHSTVTRRFIFVACILLAVALAQMFPASERFHMSLFCYLQYFLAGLLLADIFVLRSFEQKSANWWDICGLIAAGLLFRLDQTFFAESIVLPFAAFALCLAALRGNLVRSFFSNKWIAVFGGMCYSLYLTHFMMIAVIFKFTRRMIVMRFDFLENLLIQIAVTTLPAMAAGVVYYLLIERPCMDPDWPSKLWSRVTGRRHNALDALDSAGISD